MVRKVTTAGGWRKRAPLRNQHRNFEQSASRTLLALPTNASAWRHTTIKKLIQPLARHSLPPTILAAFHTAIHELVNLEAPTLPGPTTGARTAIDGVTYRARLRALLAFKDHADQLLDDWTTAMSHLLQRLAAAVPITPLNAKALTLTVPFIHLAPAPIDLVSDIVARLLRFAQTNPDTVAPGAVIARCVKDALLNVSKLTEDAAAKNPHRLVSPKQSGLTGEALVAAYLSDTPFDNSSGRLYRSLFRARPTPSMGRSSPRADTARPRRFAPSLQASYKRMTPPHSL